MNMGQVILILEQAQSRPNTSFNHSLELLGERATSPGLMLTSSAPSSSASSAPSSSASFLSFQLNGQSGFPSLMFEHLTRLMILIQEHLDEILTEESEPTSTFYHQIFQI